MAFHGIVLTDEDVQEVRALWSEYSHSLKDLSIIFDCDYRYLHKVVHYEVRANVPDIEGMVRRPKRTWQRKLPKLHPVDTNHAILNTWTNANQ